MAGWFERVRLQFQTLANEQRGQGMVEHAPILVLIAVVVIVIMQVVGHQVNNVVLEREPRTRFVAAAGRKIAKKRA